MSDDIGFRGGKIPDEEIKSLYDSPIEIQFKGIKMAQEQSIRGAVLKTVQQIGINICEQDLVEALNADKVRYEKAYDKGYSDCMNKTRRGIPPKYESEPHCGHCGFLLDNSWEICPKCRTVVGW